MELGFFQGAFGEFNYLVDVKCFTQKTVETGQDASTTMTELRKESMNIRVKKTVGGTTETNCHKWQLFLLTFLVESKFYDPQWHFSTPTKNAI